MTEETKSGLSAPGYVDGALDRTRNKFTARLPGLMEAAFRRYEYIAGEVPTDDAKAIAAHAGACRAALGHLEQLLKLSKWAGSDKATTPPPDDVERLIADAEGALEKAANDT